MIEALESRWGIAGRLTELPPGSLARAWRVDTVDGPVVAKLARNTVEHLDLGLRLAQVVDDAVLPTGRPVPALDGSLAIGVGDESFAVLEHVPGVPPTIDDLDVADLGRLLGRELARLRRWIDGWRAEVG